MILTTYLIVRDMNKSLAFYKAFFDSEPFGGCLERFAIFGIGKGQNASLALYDPSYDEWLIQGGTDLSEHFNEVYLRNQAPVRYGNNVVLNIGVEDLASEYDRIKKLEIGEISDFMYVNITVPYWFFNLTDPDGNTIEITGAYTPKGNNL